ncbi:MAG: tRNA ((37)-N6)-threonylcarbamoyltransferase complex dimerization subunit type 1 TsaB [Bacteroidota bacterium]|jgi:tRNA threonylcarbamoyladenosine biosynthesis protein TsaB
MPHFLLIDTSTSCCSVAIAKGETVLHQQIKCEGNDHASLLPSFTNACLSAAQLSLKDINAIAISIGPGSYTGLRVGLSFAKALCYANQIPLIAISTLQMMACGMQQITQQQKAFYIPMIDARRMEVYTAVFNEKGDWIEKPFPKILTESFIAERNLKGKIFIAGNGAIKIKPFIHDNEIEIIDHFICEAKHLIGKANELYQTAIFADVAYTEPFYLKQFGEIL